MATGGVGLPQDTQRVSTEEVVVTDVLVSSHIYHLQNQEREAEMQFFSVPWAKPEITKSSTAHSDRLSVTHSATALLLIRLGHYLPPPLSTGTFPLDATILLWIEIFCFPHYTASRWNSTEFVPFVLMIKGVSKDANIGTCLLGLPWYVLFSRWTLGGHEAVPSSVKITTVQVDTRIWCSFFHIYHCLYHQESPQTTV